MIEPTHSQQRAWMSQWRSAAIALARLRAQELAGADLARVAADLDDVSIAAARLRGRETTSGLIARQRIFQRIARGQIRSELAALAALKEAPELLDELDRIADGAAKVIGPFSRDL